MENPVTYEMKCAYAEVDQILENLPAEYRNKIPKKILATLKNQKSKHHTIQLNPANLFDKTALSRQTLGILAMLNYQYWCPNRKIKNDLYQIYLENEKRTVQYQELFPTLSKNKGQSAIVTAQKKNRILAKIVDFFRKLCK